jgi:flagellar biogenesis protein FliO
MRIFINIFTCSIVLFTLHAANGEDALPIGEKPKSSSENWGRSRYNVPKPPTTRDRTDSSDIPIPSGSEIRKLIAKHASQPTTRAIENKQLGHEEPPVSVSPSKSYKSNPNLESSPSQLLLDKENAAPPLDLSGLIYRLVLTTGGLLAVAVCLLILLKNWIKKNAPPTDSGCTLRLLESISLPQKSSLQIVKYENRTLIVGMNPNGLTTIMPLAETFDEHLASLNESNSTNETDDDSILRLASGTSTDSTSENQGESDSQGEEKMGWAAAFQTSIGNIIKSRAA